MRSLGNQLICAAMVVAAPLGRSGAATIHVPADYPTIQAAVDAASDGDLVLVADGIYDGPANNDIDFGGRLITLRSAGGPHHCIIDCELNDQHRGFHFHSGETAAAVVDGFTIRGGHLGSEFGYGLSHGGGIRIDNSSPTIANCHIVDNGVVTGFGYAAGGGIYSSGGSPTLINCTIDGNGAGGNGGSAAGGGIFHSGGLMTLVNCTISGNGTGADFTVPPGGGAAITGGLLVNCIFSGNQSKQGGGLSGSGLTVINCTFSENTLTTTGNYHTSGGGGFSGTGQFANCVFWGNLGLFDKPDQIQGFPGTTVSHSDIQGGWTGPGANNIDADPLFVNPNGPDGQAGTPDDDLTLRPGSPCIDAGDGSAVPGEFTTDLSGSARAVDDQDTPDCPQAPGQCGGAPVVDMGPYEYHLPCPWDLDFSASVGAEDFAAILLAWGTSPVGAPDFDGDGSVGIIDFLALLSHWGPCCGPAAAKEPDCDGDGFSDACNIDAGQSNDCNGNTVPDECDLAEGTSTDCDLDAVPDDCEFTDCNGNGIADQCDLAAGTGHDCNGDSVLDECQEIGCGGCVDEVSKLVAPDAGAGDQFGISVSVSGNRALIGAPFNDGNGFNAGAAYALLFNGNAWVHEATLAPAVTGFGFGRLVSISDGVAAIKRDNSVFVFRHDGAQWVEEATLVRPGAPQFGDSISISGDVVVVGAPGYSSSAAYVFRFDGTKWVQEANLTSPATHDFFGLSVSVSGDVVLVGAIGDVLAGTGAGAAYVFRFDGTQWIMEQELTASDGAVNDWFGASVSVRGGVALIGATYGNQNAPGPSGSAYVFRYDGAQWVEEAELTAFSVAPGEYVTTSVSVGSDVDVAAMGTSSPEAAFVFLFDGAQWVGQAKLSGSDTEAGDQFGASVSISGSMAFVGAYGDDDAGSSSGSVYVFRGLSDCNRTAQLDVCELLDGAAEDLNDDGLPDECVVDCNLNGVLDGDDIAGGTSQDCNGDGVPDECGDDCNVNGLADSCDIASGTSQDCNADGLPDECGPDDCNLNGFADSCDIAGGASQDCNDNSIPDECEAGDCNGNGIPDSCDIAAGTSQDCNGNGIPDECEAADCNGNGIPDSCDIAAGTSQDCNRNGAPDECEAADCNGNGVHDQCDVGSGTSTDFDGNGIPDECQIPPPNNVCGNAGPIAEGVFPFSTIGAQTDGLPTGCSGGPGLSFERDIWFLYTPSCFGTATFSVCNAANFDTRLAVYTLAPCPPLSVPLACSDNAPGCGDTSHVELLVHPAIQYLVRVGGTTSTSGLGTLTVTCRP